MDDLRYPVGKFTPPSAYGPEGRQAFIREIAALPVNLRAAVAGLTPEQIQHPYRDEGWSVAQVVHHLADSHLNAFARFKLALTEDNPRIKPYDQDAWAALADGRTAEAEASLSLVEGLHSRWIVLLGGLGRGDWARTMDHPERGKITLDYTLELYSWHCRHHVAHITGLRQRKGW